MIDYNKYTERLTVLLERTITDRDHVITGNLRDSVNFVFNKDEFKFELTLESLFYIKFLEDGMFLDYFFSLPEVDDIIRDITTEYIDFELNQIDTLL